MHYISNYRLQKDNAENILKYSQMCPLLLNTNIFQRMQPEKTLPLSAEGIFFFQFLENVAN